MSAALFIDITGSRFGKLVVIGRAPNDKAGNSKWLCRCDCGAMSTPLAQSLRSGATASCGCRSAETNSLRISHGHARNGDYSRTYGTWDAMLQRCNNPSSKKWARYGGRGIQVCEAWRVFENFLADMGERPMKTTLDRRDNNGNYEPGNCRWATPTTQANNRGNNRIVLFDGTPMTATEASRMLGDSRATVSRRMRDGWSEERATSTPLKILKTDWGVPVNERQS